MVWVNAPSIVSLVKELPKTTVCPLPFNVKLFNRSLAAVKLSVLVVDEPIVKLQFAPPVMVPAPVIVPLKLVVSVLSVLNVKVEPILNILLTFVLAVVPTNVFVPPERVKL